MAPSSNIKPLISILLIPPFPAEGSAGLAAAFGGQTAGLDQFELVITKTAAPSFIEACRKYQLQVAVSEDPAESIASILNSGHKVSRGDIVFPFYAADIPDSRLIAEHLALHLKAAAGNTAVKSRAVYLPGQSLPYHEFIDDPRSSVPAAFNSILEGDDDAAPDWFEFSIGLTSYQRSLFESCGGFDSNLTKLIDLDFALRLNQRGLKIVKTKDALVGIPNFHPLAQRLQSARIDGREAYSIYRKYHGLPLLKPLRIFLNGADIVAAAAEKQQTIRAILSEFERAGLYDSALKDFTLSSGEKCSSETLARLYRSAMYYEYLCGAAESCPKREIDPLQGLCGTAAFLFVIDRLPERALISPSIAWLDAALALLNSGAQVVIAAVDRISESANDTVQFLQDSGAVVLSGPLKRIRTNGQSLDSSSRTDLRTILCEREFDVIAVSDGLRTTEIIHEIRRFHGESRIIIDADSRTALKLAQTGKLIPLGDQLKALCESHRCELVSTLPASNLTGKIQTNLCYRSSASGSASFAARAGALLLADERSLKTVPLVLDFLQTVWLPLARKNPALKLLIPASATEQQQKAVGAADSIIWCGDHSKLEVLTRQALIGAILPGTSESFRNSLTPICSSGLPIIMTSIDVKRWQIDKDSVIAAASAKEYAEALELHLGNQDRWMKMSEAAIYGGLKTSSAEIRLCDWLSSAGVERAKTRRQLSARPDPSSFRADGKPVVSIVIPVFNKVEFTRTCIEHIRSQTTRTSYEIIVVDNGSSDETAEHCAALAAQCDNIRIITNPLNCGFAQACNQGAEVAQGEFILFLNNDTTMSEGWLEPLVEVFRNNPRAGAAGARLLYPDGTVQHAGIAVVRNRTCPIFWPFHLHRGLPPASPAVSYRRATQAITGACMLIRAEHFKAVCGFDQEYWNGCEDVDLCFKLRARGLEVIYEPASTLIHYEAQSGAERFRCENQNLMRLLAKWGSAIKPDYAGFPPGFPADWKI